MTDITKVKKATTSDESTDFFEAMPMTAGHFVFRDDVVDDEMTHSNIQDEIRTTAIVTLVLVAIVAVALSLLVWQGLGTIKGITAPTANATSTEL
jgi:hypothetical protein